MSQLDMKTPNLTDENIKKLGELFPSCVTETLDTEGKPQLAIDFDLLKQELSHSIVEGPVERYQLDWPGKRESLLTANAPIAKTLRPVRDESVNFDETENLFIEGDNLEALKLLQESYLGKVKMIYIDPPYNTGNDFVYNDDFAEDSDEYFERSLQKDEEGNRLVANPESKGRYHSDWLSMMHSRLRLARNLLTDDGVIFISIDDNEQANLKRLCDEIFGEQNFVANIVWLNQEGGGGSDSIGFRVKHESILCYKKSDYEFIIKGLPINNVSRYSMKDEYENIRGPYYLQKLGMGSIQYSESLDYEIISPDNTSIFPKDNNNGKKACWRWSKKKLEWGIQNSFVEIKKDTKGIWTVYTKQYLCVDNNGVKIERTQQPLAIISEFSSTQASKNLEIMSLNYFSYSKPHQLLMWLLGRIDNQNEIILDFFAGSSTTAHAVMQLNAEDGGNRKFIMVQLPEATDEKSEAFKAGYKNIAEISKERIRRAGQQILETDNINENWNKDIGFRVLKTDESNMKDVFYKPQALNQSQLFDQVDNVKEDRNAEDLLFQIMLDWGLELSLPVHIETIQGKQVYCVAEDALIACFDQDITEDLVKELANKQPMRLLFRDNYYANNDVKINAGQLVKQLSPKTELKSI